MLKDIDVKGIRLNTSLKKLVAKALLVVDRNVADVPVYGEMCELIAQLKIAKNENVCRETFNISTNLFDFFRESDGNSWRSCHNMENGDYRGGCLSYANDTATSVVYKENSDGRLIYRAMLYITSDGFTMYRWYGDDSSKKLVIAKIENIIGQYYNVDDNNVTSAAYFDSGDGYQYPDYDYRDAILNKYVTLDIDTEIGAISKCLMCGDELFTEEAVNCYECIIKTTDDIMTCTGCGCDIQLSTGEYYILNGEYYCTDCTGRCDECGDVHLSGELHSRNYEQYCEPCFMELFDFCENCGEPVTAGQLSPAGLCDDCQNDSDDYEEL